jgi:hypothetical protein
MSNLFLVQEVLALISRNLPKSRGIHVKLSSLFLYNEQEANVYDVNHNRLPCNA